MCTYPCSRVPKGQSPDNLHCKFLHCETNNGLSYLTQLPPPLTPIRPPTLMLTTTPVCASLTSTAHNKSDTFKKKRKAGMRQGEGERAGEKCRPLSAGFPLFSLSAGSHPLTPKRGESGRQQVTDDQRKVNMVNWEVDQRGLSPSRS